MTYNLCLIDIQNSNKMTLLYELCMSNEQNPYLKGSISMRYTVLDTLNLRLARG